MLCRLLPFLKSCFAPQGFLISPTAAVSSGWGSDSVSKQLKVVANIIAAHQLTGSEREVFFVRYSGWDTHGSVDFPGTASYPGKWDNVNAGLSKFVAEMKSLGVSVAEPELTRYICAARGETVAPRGVPLWA